MKLKLKQTDYQNQNENETNVKTKTKLITRSSKYNQELQTISQERKQRSRTQSKAVHTENSQFFEKCFLTSN